MPSDKDRELQIELVRLQVQAQLYTTAAFGFAAIGISVLVLFETLYFTLPPDQALIKNVIPYFMVLLAVAVTIVTWLFLKKTQEVEGSIEGLKGRFVKKVK